MLYDYKHYHISLKKSRKCDPAGIPNYQLPITNLTSPADTFSHRQNLRQQSGKSKGR